jgi:hypothetical protein
MVRPAAPGEGAAGAWLPPRNAVPSPHTNRTRRVPHPASGFRPRRLPPAGSARGVFRFSRELADPPACPPLRSQLAGGDAVRFDAATALRLLADNAESHAALLAEPVIQAILQAAGVARAPRHAPTQAKALGALRAMAQCGTDATRAALARAGACDAAESALESEDPGVRRAGAGARAELAGPRALGEDPRSSPPPFPPVQSGHVSSIPPY